MHYIYDPVYSEYDPVYIICVYPIYDQCIWKFEVCVRHLLGLKLAALTGENIFSLSYTIPYTTPYAFRIHPVYEESIRKFEECVLTRLTLAA